MLYRWVLGSLARIAAGLGAGVAVWAVWAEALAQSEPAATATNPVTASSLTVATRALERVVPGHEFIERNRSVLSFGLDRIPGLQVEVFTKPLWQYFATLFYIGLAFAASKALDRFINVRLKAWAARTETRWDDILLNLLDGPVKVVTFVILLHIGLQLFDWPIWLKGFISKFTLIIVFISVAYVLLKAVDALVGVAKTHLASGGERAFNEQFLTVCGKALKVVLITVAFLTLLANFDVNITALLGSLSVLGLALGLAAQDTVSNLFGAVSVFVDKPFQIGDRIQVGGVDGAVEEMGLRATRVRTLDGYLVTVPNKTVGNNTVTNISRRPSIKTELNYGLTYETPAVRVRAALRILEEIFRAHPQTTDVIVVFDRMLDSSLNLKVIHWWGDQDSRANLLGIQELNLKVKERFDAEGLEFAFPSHNVYVRPSAAAQITTP